MEHSGKDPRCWETLSSKTIIKDRWVHLRADECRMADGTMIAPFYVNEMPDFVVVTAVTEDGQFLMIRQYRHAVDKVILEIPAGCVEPGEDMQSAAGRELLEETGYASNQIHFLGKVAPNASSVSNYAWCYLALDAKKCAEQSLDDTEEITVELMTEEQIRSALRENHIEQAVHVAALYRALEELCLLREK